MFELWFTETTFFKNVLIVFFIHVFFIGDAHQERHFLHYRFTALSGSTDFPEFSATAVADDRLLGQCRDQDKLWVQTEEQQTHAPDSPPDSRSWMMEQIRTLTHCTHTRCPESHVLQRITGCELERFPDGSVKSLTAFDEYGFDGEDFISFDSDTMKWIEKNPKATETKKKWDLQTGRNQFIKHYLKNCMSWISTYNNTREILPHVRLFARNAPDDRRKLIVTCQATDFYPRDGEVYIRLNKTIVEDQDSSGIRPNADGSFQISTSVKIDRDQEGFYDCVFIHSSLTETISVKQAGARVDCEAESPSSVIAAVTGALLTVGLVLFVCLIYKKKSSGGILKMFCYDCGRKKMKKTKDSNPSLTDSTNAQESESAMKTKQPLIEER